MTLTELETFFSQNNCIESPYQDENHKVYARISDNIAIAKICISSTSLHLLDNVKEGELVFNFSDPNNDATIKFCVKALAVSETHAQNYINALKGRDEFAGIDEVSFHLEQDANKIWRLVIVVDTPNATHPDGPHFHKETVITTDWGSLSDDTKKACEFWIASLESFRKQLTNQNNSTLII
jgi:hypothetical protein